MQCKLRFLPLSDSVYLGIGATMTNRPAGRVLRGEAPIVGGPLDPARIIFRHKWYERWVDDLAA